MIKGQGGSLKEDNFTHEFSALVTISHTAALVIGLVFAKNSPSSQNLKHLWRDVREGGGGGGSGATVLFSLAVFGGLACVEGAWEIILWMCGVVFETIGEEGEWRALGAARAWGRERVGPRARRAASA